MMTTTEHRSTRTLPLPENTTPILRAKIVDELGGPLSGDVLLTLTLTIYNRDTGTIINGRDHVNILNANGGVVYDAYENDVLVSRLLFQLTANDMAILEDSLPGEGRVALLEWSWNGGASRGKHEVWFTVENLEMVA